ncbi:hypothetical protein ABVT39_019778 [Epinephelus coioides]
MDDLPVKYAGPSYPKITLSCKTLDVYLKLVLLLLQQGVKRNQSLMQHCPITTELGRLPNFSSQAGSAFFFKLPISATQGHTRRHKLSLADGDRTLPHWMVFRQQISTLAGLALTEDCGIYHLKVSDIEEQCAAYFCLHILNRTLTDKDQARDTLSCSEGETTIWANLLLQLNPATLDASQRIRLVSTMAVYLRLPLGFVYLFSRKKSSTQQQEKTTLYSDSAHVYALLESQVFTGKIIFKSLPNWPSVHSSQKRNSINQTASRTNPPVEATLCSNRVSEITSDRSEYFRTTELFLSPFFPERTSTVGMLPTADTALSTLLASTTLSSIYPSMPLTPASYSVTSTLTHEAADRKSLATSLTLRPHQKETPLWTGSYGGSLTDSESQPTVSSLADKTSVSRGVDAEGQDNASHRSEEKEEETDEEGQEKEEEEMEEEVEEKKEEEEEEKRESGAGTAKKHSTSLAKCLNDTAEGHIVSNHRPIKGLHAAKPLLYNLPSVSHPPPTENYTDASLLNSRLKTVHSQPPSNEIPSTRPFPDVSPTSYIMTERLSRTQHSDTSKHLSSVLNQDVMSQLNVATQDVSSTTSSGQPTLSGKTELESSLSTSLFESSVITMTPALPSELGFSSGQLDTPIIINPTYPGDSLKLASSSPTPQLLAFSKSLPPDIRISYLQSNIESPVVTDLQSQLGVDLYVDLNPLMQTLCSDISSMSLQPIYTSQAPQMSPLLIKTLSVPLSMFKDQPFKEPSARESVQSVRQTLHTLLLGESHQIDTFHHISLVTGMTTSMYLNTAAGPGVTYPLPISVSESARQVSEFDPTAPSTVQELYTTSFIQQMQNLDPSFPVCGQSVIQDHVYVLMFDSSRRFFSTETSREYLSMHPLPSEDILMEQTESNALMSSLLHLSGTIETNQLTATPQLDISEALPALGGTGFSVITSPALDATALSDNYVSLENSLFICQSSATKGRPTQQILSTSLRRFYGTSTALLTSSKAVGLSSYRRESSVLTTPSSPSISSVMNHPPTVLQSVPVLMATVGFPFHYSIPPKTFHDPEDGAADALSLEMRLIDGPPISVGTWLALDGLELHGVPLEVDLQFAPQHLLLGAKDRQGQSTWLPLTLDLRRSAVDPCHIFTLTAQRSLHSVLRQRHRVELLLRKLSRFFNSSSSHHLSVVSMRPGSTVVSWYNYSLCGMGQSRVTRCHVDQIRNMWLAMRSTDGSVNPAFREAMLPEFPVTKVGPVSFRRDCFTTTSTTMFEGSTSAIHTTLTSSSGTNTSLSPNSSTCVSTSPTITTTSHQTTRYQWMAGMFTAVLVVCILILIVLLVATVLYFCKGRGRSRTVAIWPASRVLSVQCRDLRAIRPRRPPIFQPELPPPPLRLWISLSQGDEVRFPSTREQEDKTADKALQPRPPRYEFSNI